MATTPPGDWRHSASDLPTNGSESTRAHIAIVGDRRIPLGRNSIVFGRRDELQNLVPDVDLTEEDPGMSVSRLHLQLRVVEGQVEAIDLGSTNGTFLKGDRLPTGEPIALADEARLELGDLSIVVCVEQDSAQGEIAAADGLRSVLAVAEVPESDPVDQEKTYFPRQG